MYWELKKSAAFFVFEKFGFWKMQETELFKFLVFFSMRKDFSSLVYHVEV